jgi:hypothetical protein
MGCGLQVAPGLDAFFGEFHCIGLRDTEPVSHAREWVRTATHSGSFVFRFEGSKCSMVKYFVEHYSIRSQIFYIVLSLVITHTIKKLKLKLVFLLRITIIARPTTTIKYAWTNRVLMIK